jgi:predicted O-methyltransferase YrrM
MRCFTASDLGAVPVKGPFSHYLNAQETAILVALVNGAASRVMIEFGCNQGITAKRLLDNVASLQRYIGIDVAADHVPTLACQSSEVPIVAGHYAATDVRFSVYLAPSITIGAEQLEPCDAVFIDGDHSAAAVTHESHLAAKLVRPGGVICWHDYGNPAVEVTQALNRLYDRGWPISRVDHSWLAFMRV